MQTTWRTLLRMLLALTLVIGVAACGDDDDDGDAASASASTAAEDEGGEEDEAGGDFCGALQAFHGQLFDVQVEDDASEEEIQGAFDTLDPLWADVEASVPDEFSDDVEELGSTIDALGEGDAEPFNADDTSTTYFTMVGEALDGCVEEVIEVTGVDYAFTGVPETVPSGPIGMRFTNGTDAEEQHEFIIFKKADGDTRSAEEILNDPASQEQGPGEFAGAVFATPGTTAGTFLDLAPGDYIAVCFIPVGSGEHEMPDGSMEDGGEDQATDDQAPEEEGESGPPHFTQGMVAEFSVA
jgi:hypothetical protein